MFYMFVSLDIIYKDAGRKEKKRFVRRVMSDGRDMLPFSRFTHTTQRHKALTNESGKMIFSLAYAYACAPTVHS